MKVHEWREYLDKRYERTAENIRRARAFGTLPYNDDGFSLDETDILMKDIREGMAKYLGFFPEDTLSGTCSLSPAPGMWGEARSTGNEHRLISSSSREVKDRRIAQRMKGTTKREPKKAPQEHDSTLREKVIREQLSGRLEELVESERRDSQQRLVNEYFLRVSFLLGYNSMAPEEELAKLNVVRRDSVNCTKHNFKGVRIETGYTPTCTACGLTRLAYESWQYAYRRNEKLVKERAEALLEDAVHRKMQYTTEGSVHLNPLVEGAP